MEDILNKLLEIGFSKIGSEDGADVQTFRLYEQYNHVRFRIIVTLKNDIFKVKHIFFYSSNSDELQLKIFGQNITVEGVIERVKALHKTSKPFNLDTETG